MAKFIQPKSFAIHLILLLFALIALLPFAWLICAAFKPSQYLFSTTFLPWHDLGSLTLDNFRDLRGQPFGRWLVNSLFLASANTTIVVTLSSLGGFALAKYDFRGKRPIMAIMLATMLIPGQVTIAGSYDLIYTLGWIDSYLAILIPGAVSVLGIFLMRQAMLGIPDELLQCGRLDGCNELRLWWDVALPVVRPMIGAFTLLSFLASWNSFMWPQIVLQNDAKYTLPIGMNTMIALPEYQTHFGILMAATIISIMPVGILFIFLQKDFIAGLASGAVKG